MRAHRLAAVLTSGLLPLCLAVPMQRGLRSQWPAGGQEAVRGEARRGGSAALLDGSGSRGYASAGFKTLLQSSYIDKRAYGAKRHGLLKDVCYTGAFNDPNSEACLQGQRLLFLHIPKTAGSDIEAAAQRRGVRWGRHMRFHGCRMGRNSCRSRWHQPPALMNDINVYSNASVFCVVRNPFARAISEYRHVVMHWATLPIIYPHKDIAKKYGCSARGLNEWLAVSVGEFAGGNFGLRDCHMVPQSSYIWGPPDDRGEQCQFCHEILRLEEFPRAFDSLMDRYGYSIRLGAKPMNAGACRNLGMKDLNATTIRLLQSVYEDDFKMLNYSTEVS